MERQAIKPHHMIGGAAHTHACPHGEETESINRAIREMWHPIVINRIHASLCSQPKWEMSCNEKLCNPFEVLTRAFPAASTGLLNSDRWHIVATGWWLQAVTADFEVLHGHFSTGLAQNRVAAILQHPRLPRLKTR